MPIVSVFFGIVIRMFYDDHEPPHFHAEYQGRKGSFDFHGRKLSGQIRSTPALRRIEAWAVGHRSELSANWERVKQRKALKRIEPLR